MKKREFLINFGRAAAFLLLGGGAGLLIRNAVKNRFVRIDPAKCSACGKCETACILQHSAVKCVNDFEKCGYCRFCSGYFLEDPPEDESAVKLVCPVNALKRRYINKYRCEYTIDESLCIGCGKCVKRCKDKGNGSLFLEIRNDICVNCNNCSIQRICPDKAIEGVRS